MRVPDAAKIRRRDRRFLKNSCGSLPTIGEPKKRAKLRATDQCCGKGNPRRLCGYAAGDPGRTEFGRTSVGRPPIRHPTLKLSSYDERRVVPKNLCKKPPFRSPAHVNAELRRVPIVRTTVDDHHRDQWR